MSAHYLEKDRTLCYNTHITFGKETVDKGIDYAISLDAPNYVCVIDINVIALTYVDAGYKEIIDRSFLNTCDGSFLAVLKNIKSKENIKYTTYTGPELFENYISRKDIKHLLVGPGNSIYNRLLGRITYAENIYNLELPYLDVDHFDYEKIAQKINDLNPSMIWIMLGAPKQEVFIAKILHKLNRGLLIGSGAALNLFLEQGRLQRFSILGFKFIWLKRLWLEPKKQSIRICRFLKVLPKVIATA